MGLVKATGERTLGESEPDTNAPSTNFQKWTAHLHWSTITWSILCETSIVYLLVRTTHDGTIFGCGLWMNNRAIMWSRVRHHVTGLLTRVSLWKCIFLATRGEPHDRFPSFFFFIAGALFFGTHEGRGSRNFFLFIYVTANIENLKASYVSRIFQKVKRKKKEKERRKKKRENARERERKWEREKLGKKNSVTHCYKHTRVNTC